MRGYCVGRPVALSVPKFSFAWNSFQLFPFDTWFVHSIPKIHTCFGMRASLKQGSVRSSFLNHFLQRSTICGWCSTSSSNALGQKQLHLVLGDLPTWQLPQKWRRREWVQSLQRWAPGQSCWRTSSPHWECFLFGSSLCMLVSRGVDLAIVSMLSLMTDTLSNWTPRFLKPPARKWVFVSWTWHYIFGLR